MVDVVDELVERPTALLQTASDLVPLAGGDDPRDGVEREDFFSARVVAVDVKGDAHPHQGSLRGLMAADQLAVFERLDAVDEGLRFRTHRAVHIEHLVVEFTGLVGVEAHAELTTRLRGRDTEPLLTGSGQSANGER